MVPTAWRALIGHMRTVDKHLIPFTGADRYNYNFIISSKSKDRTYQFRLDCAAFLGSTTPTMAISAGQNGIYCLEGLDRPSAQLCRHGAGRSARKALKKQGVRS